MESISLFTVTVIYLFIGVVTVRRWFVWGETGKGFLIFVFPAHVLLYLLFSDWSPQMFRTAIKNIVLVLVGLAFLFLILAARK